MILTNSNIANIVAITLAVIDSRDLKGVDNTLVEIHLITTTIIFSLVDSNQNKARFEVIIYTDGEIVCDLSCYNDFNRSVVHPEHLHKADVIINILEGVMADYE